ncbi:MAG: ribose 5-phosphate isomerase A, partial [Chloroflexi bacterium]|nr:ribose 5-phosphate isomerase A [Chloroflexota bacterium]
SLIKGHGGALLREKIVAAASRRFVIIVDESKIVGQLGTTAPLPVEVIPFGWRAAASHVEGLGAQPELRRKADGEPFVTDEGNYILDCRFPGIPDPAALDRQIRSRAGIVETGLFVGMASEAIVASAEGVRSITLT